MNNGNNKKKKARQWLNQIHDQKTNRQILKLSSSN